MAGKFILKVDGTKVSEERGIDLVAGTNVTLTTAYPDAAPEAAGGTHAPPSPAGRPSAGLRRRHVRSTWYRGGGHHPDLERHHCIVAGGWRCFASRLRHALSLGDRLMADTGKILYSAQPGTGDTLLYTVPASTTTAVRGIHVCNTTGTAAT